MNKMKSIIPLESPTLHNNHILDFVPAMISLIDSNLEYTFVNQEYEKTFNIKRENIIGQKVFQILGKEAFDAASPHLYKALNGQTSTFENHLLRKDGNKQFFKITYTPYYLEDEIVGAITLVIDITDQKHKEEQLNGSADLYHSIFDTNQAIKLLTDPDDGKIVDFNLAASNYYGYTPEELRTLNFNTIQVFQGEENQLWMSNGKSLEKSSFESRHCLASGEIREVEVHQSPLQKDKKTLVYSIIHDVTKRKKLEESLKKVRQNYEVFFNTIDDFLFVIDQNAAMIYVNDTVVNRLEYQREELIGQSVLMIHPPERREEVTHIVEAMLAGTQEFCPVPIMTRSGKLIPVETRINYGIWDEQRVIFGVTKDISKIKFSEEKFSKAFYINPSACGLTDLESGVYIEVNDAFCLLFGYEREEVIGKTARELGILTHEGRKSLLKSMSESGKILEYEADLQAKDGSIRNTIISAEDVYVQDRKLRYTVVNDLTARRDADRALKESELRLRQLNATKDKFFSIIAHDLRSPFASILGFCELLTEEVQNENCEGIKEYAKIISDSSNRALNLLQNLLEWSRTQTGAINYSPSNFEIADLIDEVVCFLSDSAHQKSLTITKKDCPSLNILADRDMIAAVLRNLISNSIKFTNPGGRIEISLQKFPEELRIIISDDGVGIDKKNLENLFRIEKSYSTIGTANEHGTGLGLILCKEFIDIHGGTIWVESEKGEGSKFIFNIPISIT
jgi:PAS domain S-box-containing protein